MVRLIAVIWLSLLISCKKPESHDLVVFAASSMQIPLESAYRDYHKLTQQTVQFVFAGSSTLARQIALGAPAHIFFTAHPQWIAMLEEHKLAAHVQPCIASNQLVIASLNAHALSPFELTTIGSAKVARIAVGDPAHVPQGVYAKQALNRLELWNQIEDLILPTKDAAAALSYLKSGAVDYALVYESELAQTDGLFVMYRIDPALHDPIQYAAITLTSIHPQAIQFLHFFNNGPYLRAAGFTPCEGKALDVN